MSQTIQKEARRYRALLHPLLAGSIVARLIISAIALYLIFFFIWFRLSYDALRGSM